MHLLHADEKKISETFMDLNCFQHTTCVNLMTGICVVLFTCSREFGPDYNHSIEFYSREIPVNNLFHIDCVNWSTRINHLDYMQGEKPSLTNHRGMYFSKHEILQLNAVVKYLPKYCEFVYKITGKYQISHLWSTLKLINHNFTNLVIQGSRRHSFWGWSCELFGAIEIYSRLCLWIWFMWKILNDSCWNWKRW